MKIKDFLQQQASQLQTETAQLDSEILFCHVTGLSRAQLRSRDEIALTSAQQQQLTEYITRRQQGEPVAYIVGRQEFWSMNLTVTPAVLIPRADTECIVEAILDCCDDNDNFHCLDLGTGSGAIALALAKERPHWHVDATDQSLEALAIAKQNAKQHDLQRVQFYQGHWYQALPDEQAYYDIIVSNPPYIKPDDPHLQDLQFEPSTALVAAEDGLKDLKIIIAGAAKHLKPGGLLVLEHGYDQADIIADYIASQAMQVQKVIKDYSGITRGVIAQIAS